MPLSPNTPTLKYLVSLNMPRGFRNKRGCWIFFLRLNKKSTIFPGRFRLIHIMWLWIHAFRPSFAYRLLRQPHLHVSHERTAPAACTACNSQRHPSGNHSTHAFGHIRIVDSPSWSRTPGLMVLLCRLKISIDQAKRAKEWWCSHDEEKRQRCLFFPKNPKQG